MKAYIATCSVSGSTPKSGSIDYRVLVFVDDAKDVAQLAEQAIRDDKEYFGGREVKFFKASECPESNISDCDVGYIWNHGIDMSEAISSPVATRQIPARIGFALKGLLDEIEGIADISNEPLDELVISVATETAVSDMNATDDEAEQEQLLEQAERFASDINNLGHQAQMLMVLEAMGPSEGSMQIRSAIRPPLLMAV